MFTNSTKCLILDYLIPHVSDVYRDIGIYVKMYENTDCSEDDSNSSDDSGVANNNIV